MGLGSIISSWFSTPPVTVSYGTLSDDELLVLSANMDSLTCAAREELLRELDKRDLESAPPAAKPLMEEKTPLLKRPLSEAKKCGCGSGGCHGK
ncbi:hypothetical protein KKF84_09100 [Myxococcota bacterium]|nr:hypothetical protein [Myxococcota bacterium]MBU1535466.1 hypothetical protein [Myxococcota bacterium]